LISYITGYTLRGLLFPNPFESQLLLPPHPPNVVVGAVGVAVTVTILEYAPTPYSLTLATWYPYVYEVTTVVSVYDGEVFDVVAIVAIPLPSSRCTLIEIKLPVSKVVLAVH
jgi:hypothetical protein